MGKKKGAGNSHTNGRKSVSKTEYEELTNLNDKLLSASALTPPTKELESSSQEISRLVHQIQTLQTAETAAIGDEGRGRELKLGKFVEWCNEQGVQSDKVELALYDEFGVGLKATQKIQHHEMFLCIPRSLMMTVDLEVSSIGELLKTDPIASRMPNVSLALFLVSEKLNRSSSWKPYIDVLPNSYDTPLYFSIEEISLLKGSNTYDQSIHLQRNIARQYSYFWSLFINQAKKYPIMAKHFTYDLYRWAVSTVMTRQNIIPTPKTQLSTSENGMSGCLALIPFWDMCNHRQGEMLTDYDEDMNECHCYSMELCDPGDQVFICYSERPNSDFFVHNGFVYQDNPNNTVLLRLGLAKSDRFMKTRQSILAHYGIQGESHLFFLKSPSDNLPDDLITFLRVFNATEDEMDSLVERESAEKSCDTLKPISDENDKKCWNFLKVRCTLLLRTYTGKFSDSDFVSHMNPHHVLMATKQVESEKKILNVIINLCDSKLVSE